MTPQTANAPQAEPSKEDAAFICGREAVEEIYPLIRAFIISRLGRQIGEDSAHDAMAAILTALPKARAKTKAKFRSYCFRISYNKIYDALRSKYGNKAEPLEPIELAKAIEAGMAFTPSSSNIRADLDVLLGLLNVSKFACGQLLVDHFIIGLAPEEIAVLHGSSKAGVRMQILRCFREAKRIASKL